MGKLAASLFGNSVALGIDSETAVNASLKLVDHGHVTVAKGVVKASAIAEAPIDGTAFADAETSATFSGADIVLITTKEKSGGEDGNAYDISVLKFKAIDFEYWNGETIVIQVDKSLKHEHLHRDIDGNVATVDWDARALAENTFVGVDAFALAVEDQLSISTVLISAAIG